MVLSSFEACAAVIRDTLELLEDGPLHIEDSRVQDLLKKHTFNLQQTPEVCNVAHSCSCPKCRSGTQHMVYCKHGRDGDGGLKGWEEKSFCKSDWDGGIESGEAREDGRKKVFMGTRSSGSFDDLLVKFKRIVFLCPRIKMVGPKFYLHKHLIKDLQRNSVAALAEINSLGFTTSSPKQNETNFDFKMKNIFNAKVNTEKHLCGCAPVIELDNNGKDIVANEEAEFGSSKTYFMGEEKVGQSLCQEIDDGEEILIPNDNCVNSHDCGELVSSEVPAVVEYHLPVTGNEKEISVCTQMSCDSCKSFAENEQRLLEKCEMLTDGPLMEDLSDDKQISLHFDPKQENTECNLDVMELSEHHDRIGPSCVPEREIATTGTSKDDQSTFMACEETTNFEVQKGRSLSSDEAISVLCKDEEDSGNFACGIGMDIETDEKSNVGMGSMCKIGEVNDKKMPCGGCNGVKGSVVSRHTDVRSVDKRNVVDEVDSVLMVKDESSSFDDEIADVYNGDEVITSKEINFEMDASNTCVKDCVVMPEEDAGFRVQNEGIPARVVDKVDVKINDLDVGVNHKETLIVESEAASKNVARERPLYSGELEASALEKDLVMKSVLFKEDVGYSLPDKEPPVLANRDEVPGLTRKEEEPSTVEADHELSFETYRLALLATPTLKELEDVTREGLLTDITFEEQSAVVAQEELSSVAGMKELSTIATSGYLPDTFTEKELSTLRTYQELCTVNTHEEHLDAQIVDGQTVEQIEDEQSTVINNEHPIVVTRDKQPSLMTRDEQSAIVSAEEQPAKVTLGYQLSIVTSREQPTIVIQEEQPVVVSRDEQPAIVAGVEQPAIKTWEEELKIGPLQKKPELVTREEAPAVVTDEELHLESIRGELLVTGTSESEYAVVMSEAIPALLTEKERLAFETREKESAQITKEEQSIQVTMEKQPALATREEMPSLATQGKLQGVVAIEMLPVVRASERMSCPENQKESPFSLVQEDVLPVIMNEKLPTLETEEELLLVETGEEQPATLAEEEVQTRATMEEVTFTVIREELPVVLSENEMPSVADAEIPQARVSAGDICTTVTAVEVPLEPVKEDLTYVVNRRDRSSLEDLAVILTRKEHPVVVTGEEQPIVVSRKEKPDDLTRKESSSSSEDLNTVESQDDGAAAAEGNISMAYDIRVNKLTRGVSETGIVVVSDISLSTDIGKNVVIGRESNRDFVAERLKRTLKCLAQSADANFTNQPQSFHDLPESEYVKDGKNSCDVSLLEMGWEDISGSRSSPQEVIEEKEIKNMPCFSCDLDANSLSGHTSVPVHNHPCVKMAENCSEPEHFLKEDFQPSDDYKCEIEDEMVEEPCQAEPWPSSYNSTKESLVSLTYSVEEPMHESSFVASTDDISPSGVAAVDMELHGDIDISENNVVAVEKLCDTKNSFDLEIYGNEDINCTADVDICGNDDIDSTVDVKFFGNDFTMETSVSVTYSVEEALHDSSSIASTDDAGLIGITAADMKVYGDTDVCENNGGAMDKLSDANSTVDVEMYGNDDTNYTADVDVRGNDDTKYVVDLKMYGNDSQAAFCYGIEDCRDEGCCVQDKMYQKVLEIEELKVPHGLRKTGSSRGVTNEIKEEEFPSTAESVDIGPIECPRNRSLLNDSLNESSPDKNLTSTNEALPSVEEEPANDVKSDILSNVKLSFEKSTVSYIQNSTYTGDMYSSIMSFALPTTGTLPVATSSKAVLSDAERPDALDTDVTLAGVMSSDVKLINVVPTIDALPDVMPVDNQIPVEEPPYAMYPVEGSMDTLHSDEELRNVIPSDKASSVDVKSTYQEKEALQGASSRVESPCAVTQVSVADYPVQLNAMGDAEGFVTASLSPLPLVGTQSVLHLSRKESNSDLEMLQDIMCIKWNRENMAALRQVASEVMCIPEEEDGLCDGEDEYLRSTGEGEDEGKCLGGGKTSQERNSSGDTGSECGSSDEIENYVDNVGEHMEEDTRSSVLSDCDDISDGEVEAWNAIDEEEFSPVEQDYIDSTVSFKVIHNLKQDDSFIRQFSPNSDITDDSIEIPNQEGSKSSQEDYSVDTVTKLGSQQLSRFNPEAGQESGVYIGNTSGISNENLVKSRKEIRTNIDENLPFSSWPLSHMGEKGKNMIEHLRYLRSTEDINNGNVVTGINEHEFLSSLRQDSRKGGLLTDGIVSDGLRSCEDVHEEISVTEEIEVENALSYEGDTQKGVSIDDISGEHLISHGKDNQTGVVTSIACARDEDDNAGTKPVVEENNLNLQFEVDPDWFRKAGKTVNKYCQLVGVEDENRVRNSCGLYVTHFINKIRGGPPSKIRYPLAQSQQDLRKVEKMNVEHMVKTWGEHKLSPAFDAKELEEECETWQSKSEHTGKEDDTVSANEQMDHKELLDYELSENTFGISSSALMGSEQRTIAHSKMSELQNVDIQTSCSTSLSQENANVNISNKPCSSFIHVDSLPAMIDSGSVSMNLLYSMHLHEKALKNQNIQLDKLIRRNQKKEEEIVVLKCKLKDLMEKNVMLESEQENILNENYRLASDNSDLIDALTQCISAKDEAEEKIDKLMKSNQQLETVNEGLEKLIESWIDKGGHSTLNREMEVKLRKAETELVMNQVHFKCMMSEYHNMRLALSSVRGSQYQEFNAAISDAPKDQDFEKCYVSVSSGGLQHSKKACRESLKTGSTRNNKKYEHKCEVELSQDKLASVLSTSKGILESVAVASEQFLEMSEYSESSDEEIEYSKGSEETLLKEDEERKKRLPSDESEGNGEWRKDSGIGESILKVEEADGVMQQGKDRWTRNACDEFVQPFCDTEANETRKAVVLNSDFASVEEMEKSAMGNNSKLLKSQKNMIQHALTSAIAFNERLQAKLQKEVETGNFKRGSDDTEVKQVSLKEKSVTEASTYDTQQSHASGNADDRECSSTEDSWGQEHDTSEGGGDQEHHEAKEDICSTSINSVHMMNQKSPLLGNNIPEMCNGQASSECPSTEFERDEVQTPRKTCEEVASHHLSRMPESHLHSSEENERMIMSRVLTPYPKFRLIPTEGSNGMQNFFTHNNSPPFNGFQEGTPSEGCVAPVPSPVDTGSTGQYSQLNYSFGIKDLAPDTSNFDMSFGLLGKSEHLNSPERAQKVCTDFESKLTCNVATPPVAAPQTVVEYGFPEASTGAISKLTRKFRKYKERSLSPMAYKGEQNGEPLPMKQNMSDIPQSLTKLWKQECQNFIRPHKTQTEVPVGTSSALPGSNDLCSSASEGFRGTADLFRYLQMLVPRIPKSELVGLLSWVRKCHGNTLTGLSFRQVAEEIRQTQFEKSDMCRDLCGLCLESLHHLPCLPLHCSHTFHDQCIRAWASVMRTCPTCQCLAMVLK